VRELGGIVATLGLGGSLRTGRGCTVILVSIALLPDPFSLVPALSWVPLGAGPTVDPLEAPRSLRAGLPADLPLAVFAGALVAGSSFEPPLSVSPLDLAFSAGRVDAAVFPAPSAAPGDGFPPLSA
jgi:hypothetical protein